MENDFVIVLNDMPIECNKFYIQTNFPSIYRLVKNDESSENQNQCTIQIDDGNNFYEVTKNILQGNNYEITNDNISYLIELSKLLKNSDLKTKLNSFQYKCECDDNQIDQHPTIQFLVEITSLIHQISLENYEDTSSQIKEKLDNHSNNSPLSQNKRKKLKKIKEKNNQKKKRKSKEEKEDDDDGNKEEKIISLKDVSKLSLSKLFYIEIVNSLSSKFHTIEEYQDHQNKVELIIKLINELDSNFDDNDDDGELNTYLDIFINYVIKEYNKIKDDSISIFNHRQETFYLINYLISKKMLKIDRLQDETEVNTRNFMYPEYFLHFYPQDMIHKYFKNNGELIGEGDDDQSNESNYIRKLRSKKEKEQRQAAIEVKIKNYLDEHRQKIEEGFPFDNKVLNIIMNDDLEEFQSFVRKHTLNSKVQNQEEKVIKAKENSYINSLRIPYELCCSSCISALNNCTILELSAFFGSRNIFQYLYDKQLKREINASPNLLIYMITGNDSQIIDLYLNSTYKKPQQAEQTNPPESNSDLLPSFVTRLGSRLRKGIGSKTTSSNSYNKSDDIISYCVDLGNYELFDYIYNYKMQHRDENDTKCLYLYSKLDSFMEKSIKKSYFGMIPYLLKLGASTNVLLNLFCKTNNKIGIEYMLEFSYIDINCPYEFKLPLEFCINNKNTETSLLLLKNDKIDYKSLNSDIFISTLSKGLSKVVEYFLVNNIFGLGIKTLEGIRPIHLACKSGDFETVRTIVDIKKKAVKVNLKVTKGEYKGFTPLHFACVSGNPEIVSLLLERYKVNFNLKDAVKKWSPIQYAVLDGHSEIVKILLKQEGIETDVKTEEGETLLHLACMSNKEDIVDMLINNPDLTTKFDLNEKTLNERTPLQIALAHANYKMISILLNIEGDSKRKTKKKSKGQKQSDIDPNILTNTGQSPLVIACEMKRMDIFNLLIKHDQIDVNIQLSTGKSALYVVCELNMIEKLNTLLSFKNINVNAATKMGKTPLIVSCEKGNKQVVDTLIQYNNEKKLKKKNNVVDFNAKTKEGKTALLISCEYSRMNIVESLLEIDDIECDDATNDGRTPLCYACDKNNENIVSQLIHHHANVNYHTPDGRSILYFACCSKNANIVRNILEMIDDKSQINQKENINGTTPLFIACQNGDLEAFNLLIDEITDEDLNYQDNKGKTLIHAACEGENLEIIDKLLNKLNVDPNIANNEGKTPLRTSIAMKNADIFELIVNHSPVEIDVNEKLNDVTLLEFACEKGCFEIVQTLLKKEGIQVNPLDSKEVPPLLCACEIWRTDIIKLLLSEVPDIDVNVSQSNGRRALHYACQKGDVEISDMILSKSAECVSSRTTDKTTPLELACQNGNAEVIALLLKYIGDIQINAKFYDGNTILTKACIQQSVEIVKFLLEKTPVDVNATNNNDKTALFIVCENGNEQLCQMLLDHEKIDITIMKDQKTPLYEACKYGNAEVVDLLLKKGARADCLTKNGKTPLHVACQHGFNKVVSLLLNCPEVDVNLLTVSQQDYKTFYAPLHYACMNKNIYSHGHNYDSNYGSTTSRFGGSGSTTSRFGGFGSTTSRFGGFGSTTSRFGGFGSTTSRFGGSGSTTSHFNPNIAPKRNDDEDILKNRKNPPKSNQQLCVELLLHHPNININLQTSRNETALTIACNNQRFEIIKALLQSSQIDPNTQGNGNNTALHIACKNGKIDLVQTLLNNPKTDVNVCNSDGQTPLSIACSKDKIDLVKLLLKREDLNVCLPSQENPIRKAIRNNNSELFTILLHHPSFDINATDSNSVTPLGYAIESQNINYILQLLLAPNIDVNKKSLASSLDLNSSSSYNSSNSRYSSNLTSTTSRFGSTTSRFGSTTSRYGSTYSSNSSNSSSSKPLGYLTPLNIALTNNNYQIVKMLIQSPHLEINEYANGKTALHLAVIKDNLKILSLLLSSPQIDVNLITQAKGVSLDDYDPYLDGQNALHIAVQLHRNQVVKELLQKDDLLINERTSLTDPKYRSRINNQYANGCTALYIACSENQADIVSLMLLRSDLDLNATSTSAGLTPLHIAVQKGYINIVNILLADERCDASITSNDGTNILIFACQSSNERLLRMILSQSSDALFTCKTAEGNTPFHCVCLNNDPRILNIIISEARKKSFNIDVKNNKGETPLHIATRFNVSESLYKTYQNRYINNTRTSITETVYINKYQEETCFGILIAYGADINALNYQGQSPLYIACKNECYSNIEILMRRPEIIIESDTKMSPFSALIKKLVNDNMNSNQNRSSTSFSSRFSFRGFSSTSSSSNYGRSMSLSNISNTTISRFLDRGANYKFILDNGISFLYFGIICKSYSYVNFFFNTTPKDEIKMYLNYHTDYGSPIEAAIDNWSNDIMKLLLERKKYITFSEEIRNKIIYKCAANGDTKSLLLLLLKENEDEENDPNLNFNVNYVDDKNGETPLHAAIQSNNSIIANILANYPKTEINLLNSDGKSALHRACISNNSYMALALLTKVELKNIKRMFDDDPNFDSSSFNRFLISQSDSVSTLNQRIDINLATKGITRNEYIRSERDKILSRNPTVTNFHIHFYEPQFNNKFTALHISVANRLENVVQKILLFPNVNVNAASDHGDTPVSLAAKNWDEEIAEMLIDHPGTNLNHVPKEEESDDEFDDDGNLKDKNKEETPDPNRIPHTLTSEELEEIKEKKMNQNKTLLHAAVEYNSIGVIRHLLNLCAKGQFDINGKDSFDGMAPLHYICQDGKLSLLDLFINFEQENPNIIDWNVRSNNGMTPLHFASRGKQTRVVDILINNEIVCPHIDINATATGEFENGRTPLSFACEKGLLDIVRLLLSEENPQKPKSVEEDDPFLFESIKKQKEEEEEKEKKKKRLKRGSLCGAKSECDVSIKSKAAHQRGMSPLHYACCGSNLEVVKLILKHGGFNINTRSNGKSPLFLACQHNRVDIVKLLLEQEGIDYNIKTPRGLTPLMIASQDGRTQIVELLLQLRKIDTTALTVDGESARSMAKNQTIVNLFDKYAS